MSGIEYLAYYGQPLSGLAIGVTILAFVAYINWYGTNKRDAIAWIKKRISRNGFRSKEAADGLFMYATAILLAIGWIMAGVALLFLGE